MDKETHEEKLARTTANVIEFNSLNEAVAAGALASPEEKLNLMSDRYRIMRKCHGAHFYKDGESDVHHHGLGRVFTCFVGENRFELDQFDSVCFLELDDEGPPRASFVPCLSEQGHLIESFHMAVVLYGFAPHYRHVSFIENMSHPVFSPLVEGDPELNFLFLKPGMNNEERLYNRSVCYHVVDGLGEVFIDQEPRSEQVKKGDTFIADPGCHHMFMAYSSGLRLAEFKV